MRPVADAWRSFARHCVVLKTAASERTVDVEGVPSVEAHGRFDAEAIVEGDAAMDGKQHACQRDDAGYGTHGCLGLRQMLAGLSQA